MSSSGSGESHKASLRAWRVQLAANLGRPATCDPAMVVKQSPEDAAAATRKWANEQRDEAKRQETLELKNRTKEAAELGSGFGG